MQNNELDVQDFLQRIVRSITAFIGWLFLNMTVGIFAGFMFFSGTPRPANVIFYIMLFGSLAALVWYLRKTWKRKLPG